MYFINWSFILYFTYESFYIFILVVKVFKIVDKIIKSIDWEIFNNMIKLSIYIGLLEYIIIYLINTIIK